VVECITGPAARRSLVEGLAHEGDAAGAHVLLPVSRRLGLAHEGDAAGGDEVTLSPYECTAGPLGQRVHEEGLEPPHLAVPEPKSGWRVSKRRHM
jgi:hypothetical protein